MLVGLGAEEHRVNVLSRSDPLKMLAEWVGEKSKDKLAAEAAEVAKECGYQIVFFNEFDRTGGGIPG